MKKTLALILAVLFVLALFAGCNNGGTPAPGGTTDAGTTQQSGGDTQQSGGSTQQSGGSTSSGTEQSSGGTETTAPADEGPYHFAKGHFEYNEDGYVSEAYEYELPLSTTDEVFSYWTTCWTPQYLPEGGWQELPTMKNLEDLTGVHIEYEAVASDTRKENFSVLLAADDLRDIMDGAGSMYTGTRRSMIDDGWFINFYDYRDYMPNYLFNLWDRHDIDVLRYGRVDATTWPVMYGMLIDPAPGSGYMLREDIMEDLGLGLAKDVKTFDQWHDVLTALKANGVQWPLSVYKSIELTAGASFSGFNTSCAVTSYGLPAAKLQDNKSCVKYSTTTEDDRDLLTLLNAWYSEGLIDPNYSSYGDNNAMASGIADGSIGCVVFNPSEVGAWEASVNDPDARFRPTPRIRKTPDQILQFGQKLSNFHYGSACVSAKCSNIELVCTWLDWKWSPRGIIEDNWGTEGLIWNWNDKGERQLTDFVLHNPDGIDTAWLMVLYTNDGLRQPCLNMHRRMYAYPGGEVFLEMFDTWSVPDYGGEYDLPTGITFTDDQSEELNTLTNDMLTYIQENYFAFMEGSRSLSEFDSYVADLKTFGIDRCAEIYYDAYLAFMAEA